MTAHFRVTAARACNSLPVSITTASSLPALKRRLKTFLFAKSFPLLQIHVVYPLPCARRLEALFFKPRYYLRSGNNNNTNYVAG